jgi:acetyl-CoA carboxylase alpha subunit
MDYLAFEQPIADLEADLNKLEQEDDNSAATADKIRNLRQELNKTVRQTQEPTSYGRLSLAGL